MPNIQDHVLAIGGESLLKRPFDALDALAISQLVYLPMEGFLTDGSTATVAEAWEFLRQNVDPDGFDRFQKKRWKLFEMCAGLARYRHWRMMDYSNIIDREREMQFCACTWVLPGGMRCIAFRGTDNHVVGWKEDFNMSFMTVPSQHEAAEYILRAAQKSVGALVLCGHSKGGNLAVYAAATTDASTRERIRRIWIFDSPGMDEETIAGEGYRLVSGRIESYLPQSSIVGMMLQYHPVYTVVQSATLGILQHDVMSWQIRGGAFVTVEGVDAFSRFTDEAVRAWLARMDDGKRRLLVETLYDVVDAAQAEMITDLSTDWLESAGRMLEAIRGLEPEVKRDVAKMLHSLFATGAGEAVKQIVTSLLRLRHGETDG